MTVIHVQGKNSGNIMLYALSTCGWCQRTKRLLNDLGVEYYYLDMDKSAGDEKEKAIKEVRNWNPDVNFPTIIIDNKKCIIGFKEDEIREVLAGGQ